MVPAAGLCVPIWNLQGRLDELEQLLMADAEHGEWEQMHALWPAACTPDRDASRKRAAAIGRCGLPIELGRSWGVGVADATTGDHAFERQSTRRSATRGPPAVPPSRLHLRFHAVPRGRRASHRSTPHHVRTVRRSSRTSHRGGRSLRATRARRPGRRWRDETSREHSAVEHVPATKSSPSTSNLTSVGKQSDSEWPEQEAPRVRGVNRGAHRIRRRRRWWHLPPRLSPRGLSPFRQAWTACRDRRRRKREGAMCHSQCSRTPDSTRISPARGELRYFHARGTGIHQW